MRGQTKAVNAQSKSKQHRSGGTQSIGRAIAVLKHIASSDRAGARLVDISDALGLKTPTALRLLKALVTEGLVRFDSASKTYRIGTEFLALSAIASSVLMPTEQLMPLAAKLGEVLGDTVYLMMRSGNDAFCTAVIEGHHPIRVSTFKVGEIRPIGVGSAALAMLAFLAPEERRLMLDENAARFSRYGFTREQVEAAANDAIRKGYALNPGLLIQGVYGVGLPIFQGEKLVATIGVMAVKDQMKPKRRTEIAEIVRAAISTLSGFSSQPPYPLR